jgi:heme a synthase
MTQPQSRLPGLLLATVAMVFLLVVWGGFVRLSGSGLAIPDWPLAGGRVLPKPETRVLIEYVHRLLAGIVSLLTLAVAIAVFRKPEHRARLGVLMGAALLTLAIQVWMGGRVVLEELHVNRVVAHLLLAFLFFAILLGMTLRAQDAAVPGGAAGPGAGSPSHPGLRLWSRIGAAAIFVQAGLGAWVSSSGAALACPDFPTCHGTLIPKMEGLVGIHYAHRIGAYVVSLILIGLVASSVRVPLPPRARWPLRITAALLVLQFLLGIGNVLLRLPLPVSVAHLGTALILFGTLLVASHELSRI